MNYFRCIFIALVLTSCKNSPNEMDPPNNGNCLDARHKNVGSVPEFVMIPEIKITSSTLHESLIFFQKVCEDRELEKYGLELPEFLIDVNLDLANLADLRLNNVSLKKACIELGKVHGSSVVFREVEGRDQIVFKQE